MDGFNLSNKVLPEAESRRRILKHAKQEGCLKEMMILLAKYDNLLRHCTNEKERNDISSIGVVEIWRLLGGGGELVIDGQIVCKDD
jgi:hypothetical protein